MISIQVIEGSFGRNPVNDVIVSELSDFSDYQNMASFDSCRVRSNGALNKDHLLQQLFLEQLSMSIKIPATSDSDLNCVSTSKLTA